MQGANLNMASSGDDFKSPESLVSVLELIKQPTFTIPQKYERPGVESPAVSHANDLLPIIDMNRLASVEEFHNDELQKLHSACKHWGFFQLLNHRVSSELLDKLKYELEGFFKLPVEEKMKYKMRPGEYEGYGNVVRAGGKFDWADRFAVTTNPNNRRLPYLFPKLPPSFRNTLETYLLEMQKLGMRILQFIAKALEIEEKEMKHTFEDGMQWINMVYYPPCPQPELVIGITPHCDSSAITILNQINGVEGLQIRKDGLWFPVSFLPGAFAILVGNSLKILSNGIYQSVEHRATINSDKERMSLGFFMNPKPEAELGPFTSLINPNSPPLYARVLTEQYQKDLFEHRIKGKTFVPRTYEG